MYAKLKGAKFFTTLDLTQWILPHHPSTRMQECKTAFVIPFRKYEFNKVPFGISTSTGILSRTDKKSHRECSICNGIPR